MSTLKQEDNFIAKFAKGDSTEMDEVAAIDYFVKHFEENKEPPESFNHNLIDVFLRVLSDPSSRLRTNASFVAVRMICVPNEPAHAFVEKGTLDVFVKCIATQDEPHEQLTVNCLAGVGAIASHCDNCSKLAQATDVLEIIADKMQSGAIDTQSLCSAAALCCITIACKGEASMQLETGRLLISAIISAIRRFGINGDLYEKSLGALSYLTSKTNYVKLDEFQVKFDEMLNDSGIISIAMDAIATGSPDIVSEGLGILINALYEAGDMKKHFMSMDGCMKMMYDCLESSWGVTRVRAACVLRNLMGAATRDRIDWFSKEVEVIAQLIGLMNHHDSNLKYQVSRVFLNVFFGIYRNFDSDSASSLELFVENGVRTIVESATKSGADARLVNIIRGVLPAKLLADPEFCSEAQKYLKGPDIEPIDDVPPPNEGIISTLISYAYAMFGIASSTDDVPDPTDSAATVPENPSPV